MNSPIKQERILYADALRIVATFGVIVLHVAATKWYSTPLESANWQIMNIYDSVVRWAVPLFFMLSGMFFLDPDKDISTRKIYFKYIPRILAALVFWGIAYNIYHACQWFSGEELLRHIAKIPTKIAFECAWPHLWFLYAIIGLYIITPILRVFTKYASKQEIEYFLIIFAFIGLCIPLANGIFSKLGMHTRIQFSIVELSGYAGYFIAGYYFSHFTLEKKPKRILKIAGGVSLIATIVLTAVFSIKGNKPTELFYQYLTLTTMFEAYALFLIFKDYFEHKATVKSADFIVKISKLTFGIYLVHEFFNIIFGTIGFSVDIISPIVMIPLRSIITFILSMLVILVVSKIPVLKKYIM